MIIRSEVSSVVTWVHTLTDQVFEALVEVRDATVGLADASAGGLVSTDLAELRPLLLRHLGGTIAGLGFIATPGLLRDAPWFLEWWQHDPAGPKHFVTDLNPASSAFYDYTHWDWFSRPQNGVDRSICGPYVDYLCTDEYSLTFSAPVRAGGAFIGVAAADVFVSTFEATIRPALLELPVAAFLTNSAGRVVASNTTKWLTGSLFRGDPTYTAHPVGNLDLTLQVF
jgi:hypothetical protein